MLANAYAEKIGQLVVPFPFSPSFFFFIEVQLIYNIVLASVLPC